MRYATKFAPVALCFVMFPFPGWGTVGIQIPKAGEGYLITPTDSGQMAPAGYEGRTDISQQIAVGNTPATTGKRFVTRFKLGNQIKTCPLADGTAEGTGIFSMSVDYTDAQANGTSTLHIEMRANATYKGQVGDDAYLINPVEAEIDYTFDQTGTFRGPSGAIATSPPSHVVQHITIPFAVAKGLEPPSLGAFAGGDPTKGHYGEALGTGMALVYWAGIYYSVAETKWLQGECAQVTFSPPSNTVALGGETTVKAEVKTKAGESVKAKFVNSHAFAGTVVPLAGSSDVGAPLKFTYIAPDKKVPNAGFGTKATSRAGVAAGEWKAGLGTGWSGQITCMREMTDGGQSELVSWSGHDVMRVRYDVKNGVGTATGYGEVQHTATRRQKALRGGALTLIVTSNENSQGSVEGTSPATINISLNKAKGTYSISAGVDSDIAGNVHGSICGDNGCQESDSPLYVDSCVSNEMRGSLSDLNQLHGTASNAKPAGYTGKGTQKLTVTWDLARQGSSQ